MPGITEEDQKAMMKACKEEGLPGLKQVIVENSNKWEKEPVRIAVTGNSGVGKSSFINTFRGLKPTDPDAAAVGTTETTMEVKAYPHPKHKNFVLYDLPGVGTQQFPRESYVEEVDFNKYDFYMILSATRFTENDAWLGQKVKEQGKKFFFVRTKIDFDMYNEKKDSGENFNEERSLRKIREDAERNLRGLNAKVYLISNELRKINLFDFDRLMQDVIEGAPQVKKEPKTQSYKRTKMSGITEDDQKAMIEAFKENGLPGLKQVIVENSNKWEKIPVRIAVTEARALGNPVSSILSVD
ncbi:T-cell-specific guanine nucleotide triphosphate-binding protein 2-like [Mya arenaria]|uniref:T-cell-specific guanine nucleotide triphosphate-binding protein 2-like n=1 Tax=Mya arenaria TaxID=6604 RepID=UPI0022E317EE|nr:T-cell-specific guanine nucleotide triphosphate-binding protein 2-like [Mya arenaria]